MASKNRNRVYYYYLRNMKNVPVVTVCLLFSPNGHSARGIAFCSPKDNPNKKEGRARAIQNAGWAMAFRRVGLQVNREESFGLIETLKCEDLDTLNILTFKGWWNPTLTPLEEKIVYGPRKEAVND